MADIVTGISRGRSDRPAAPVTFTQKEIDAMTPAEARMVLFMRGALAPEEFSKTAAPSAPIGVAPSHDVWNTINNAANTVSAGPLGNAARELRDNPGPHLAGAAIGAGEGALVGGPLGALLGGVGGAFNQTKGDVAATALLGALPVAGKAAKALNLVRTASNASRLVGAAKGIGIGAGLGVGAKELQSKVDTGKTVPLAQTIIPALVGGATGGIAGAIGARPGGAPSLSQLQVQQKAEQAAAELKAYQTNQGEIAQHSAVGRQLETTALQSEAAKDEAKAYSVAANAKKTDARTRLQDARSQAQTNTTDARKNFLNIQDDFAAKQDVAQSNLELAQQEQKSLAQQADAHGASVQQNGKNFANTYKSDASKYVQEATNDVNTVKSRLTASEKALNDHTTAMSNSQKIAGVDARNENTNIQYTGRQAPDAAPLTGDAKNAQLAENAIAARNANLEAGLIKNGQSAGTDLYSPADLEKLHALQADHAQNIQDYGRAQNVLGDMKVQKVGGPPSYAPTQTEIDTGRSLAAQQAKIEANIQDIRQKMHALTEMKAQHRAEALQGGGVAPVDASVTEAYDSASALQQRAQENMLARQQQAFRDRLAADVHKVNAPEALPAPKQVQEQKNSAIELIGSLLKKKFGFMSGVTGSLASGIADNASQKPPMSPAAEYIYNKLFANVNLLNPGAGLAADKQVNPPQVQDSQNPSAPPPQQ